MMIDDSWLRHQEKGGKVKFIKEVHNYLNNHQPDTPITKEIEAGFWDYLQDMEIPMNFHFRVAFEYITKHSDES